MSFFAVFLALLIEQARPLRPNNFLHHWGKKWIYWILRNTDTNQSSGAMLAWYCAVILPVVLCVIVHWFLLLSMGFLSVLIFHVVILFLSLGFRQFSFHFTAIREALDSGEAFEATRLLQAWQSKTTTTTDTPLTSELNFLDQTTDAALSSAQRQSALIQELLKHSLLAAYKHVFAVLIWYAALAALGLGPAGAILFRLNDFLHLSASAAETEADPKTSQLSPAARHIFCKIANGLNWLPVRLSALSFAMVGNFEEAMSAWRNQSTNLVNQLNASKASKSTGDSLLLAACAGALNISLNQTEDAAVCRPLPKLTHIKSAVGLIWRAVIFWIFLIALLSFAHFFG
jgi:adenosylcobinamide-phosphate synthase